MKKVIFSLLFLTLLTLFSNSLNAQLNYTFSQLTGQPYTEITGATELFNGVADDDGVIAGIPIGFTFNIEGTNYTTLNLYTNGFIITPDSYYYLYGFQYDLYKNVTSNFSYKTEGSAPNRIFTVQYKNFDFYGSYGDVLNFQIKLYETTNQIRYCYGSFIPVSDMYARVGVYDNFNSLFLGRYTTTDWTATISTTAPVNSTISPTVYPPSGLVFTYTPIAACAAPTAQATAMSFGTVTSNTIQLNGYTAPAGGATGYAVYVNSVNTFSAPANGTEPVGDLSWNNAGQQPIYFGTSVSPSITVTGLTVGITYYFKVYAYNDCTGTETYETTGLTANIKAGNPMVLEFNTNLDPGNRTVTLPLYGTVNVNVDWGDGTAIENITTWGEKNHTYASEGTYTVKIYGSLTSFGSNGNFNADKLVKVISFGDLGLTSLYFGFYSSANLIEVPTSLPSTITDLCGAFALCTNFNFDISTWDVSNVTVMYALFNNAVAFNQNISGWDVSNVTDMEYTFYHATNFNQNIGGWNVSNVLKMTDLFEGVTLSTANYDALLNGWSSRTLKPALNFDGGNSKYSCSAINARAILTNAPNNWVVIDGGLEDVSPTAQATAMYFGTTTSNSIQLDGYTAPVGGVNGYAVYVNSVNTFSAPANGTEPVADLSWNGAGQQPIYFGTSVTPSVTVTGLTAGTTYYFKVYAYNDCAGTENYETTGLAGSKATATPMTLIFNTNLAPGNRTVTLPLNGTVNVTVNWGDGNSNIYNTAGNKDHIYAAEGTYTVTITGSLTWFGSGGYPNANKLVRVTSFGDLGLTNLSDAFFDATNLIEAPTILPTTVTSLYYTFYNCTNFNSDISAWNVSNVVTMTGTFLNASAFNQNIGGWNTSNVTSLWSTFYGATSFNQNIGSWNTSNVTTTRAMFYGAAAFNQNINGWDVSKVTDMAFMFDGATNFNQNIGSWNVSTVTGMYRMFANATNFNQNIGSWNVSNVTEMSDLLIWASSFNQNIGSWNVSNVTNMTNMLTGVTLSIANYDALLIGWSGQTLKPNVTFSGGYSKYSCVAGAAARAILTNAPNSWTIYDGGIGDVTVPVITSTHNNQTVNANASCQASLPSYTASVTATDNCTASGSIVVTQSPLAGTLITGATNTITLRATDGYANYSEVTFNVAVVDATNPVITSTHNNQSVNANASCQASLPSYTASLTATDNCTASGSIVKTQSPAAGTTISGATNTITLRATDATGNYIETTFNVAVVDVTNPVITSTHNNQTINADASCQASLPSYTASVTATDNCTASGSIVKTQSPAAGTTISGAINNVTLRATDAAGNFVETTFNVAVVDVTNPVITSTHNNQTLNANASCQASLPSYTASLTATDNCTASGSIVKTQSPAAGTTISGATNTITLRATDATGNFVETTFNVAVVDVTNPVITSTHNNQTVNANASCQASLPSYTGSLTATDNCTASGSIVKTQSPAAGTTISGVTNTVTLRATDATGNFIETTFNVAVVDNTNPVITSTHNNQTLNANASCEASLPSYTGSVTATDNCTASGSIVITQSPLAGTTISGATNTVTLRATDATGNFVETTFNVAVIDNINPVITSTHNNQTINANASCEASLPSYTGSVTATDNCTASGSIVITQSPLAGTTISGATNTVTIRATDVAGNFVETTFNVSVEDNTNPVITSTHNDQIVNSNMNCEANLLDYTASVTANDNCTASGSIVITQSPLAGTTISGAITTITLRATDEIGNYAEVTFNIAVEDFTNPVITSTHNDQTVNADASCEASLLDYTTSVISTDNCTASGSIVITQSPLAGTTISGATNTVTLRATDETGNFVETSFNVAVVDNTNPVITSTHIDQTVNSDASCEASLLDYTGSFTATDNCTVSGSIVVTQSPIAGTTISGAVNTVTLRATDETGNFIETSFNVAVVDITNPVITSTHADQTVNSNASCEASLLDYTGSVTATDNCTASGSIIITQSPVAGTTISGTTNTITLRATDATGNFVETTFNVALEDVTNPLITSTHVDQTVDANATCEASLPNYAGSVIATDNCTSNPTITQSPIAGTTISGAVNTITLRATDETGNFVETSFNVAVIDNTNPVITSTHPNQTISDDSNCQASLLDYTGSVTATDNCTASGSIVITQSPIAGTTISGAANTITLRATDEVGNFIETTFNVAVEDVTNPTVITQNITISLDETGSAVITAAQIDNGSYDNCSISSVNVSPNTFSCENTGENTVNLTVIDGSGNSAFATATVTVQDLELPELVLPANIETVVDFGLSTAVVTYASPVASDNCSIASIVQTAGLPSGAAFPLGITVNTFEATDASGNTFSASFEVNVIMETSMDITVSSLEVSSCEGDLINIDYTVLSGTPVEFQIIFSQDAKNAGFTDVNYSEITETISFAAPALVADGDYTGQIQFRNITGFESDLYTFNFTMNLSSAYVITKFDDVVLCDNKDNRFTSYQWYKDGVIINGATNQFYNDLNGLSGVYSLSVVTTDGKTLNTCGIYLNLASAKNVELSVYPNPAYIVENFVVEINNLNAEDLEGAVMSIYNVKGELVFNSKKVDFLNYVNLSLSGEYFGVVQTSKGNSYVYKVIVVE